MRLATEAAMISRSALTSLKTKAIFLLFIYLPKLGHFYFAIKEHYRRQKQVGTVLRNYYTIKPTKTPGLMTYDPGDVWHMSNLGIHFTKLNGGLPASSMNFPKLVLNHYKNNKCVKVATDMPTKQSFFPYGIILCFQTTSSNIVFAYEMLFKVFLLLRVLDWSPSKCAFFYNPMPQTEYRHIYTLFTKVFPSCYIWKSFKAPVFFSKALLIVESRAFLNHFSTDSQESQDFQAYLLNRLGVDGPANPRNQITLILRQAKFSNAHDRYIANPSAIVETLKHHFPNHKVESLFLEEYSLQKTDWYF